MLEYFNISLSNGVSNNGDGTYTVSFDGQPSRQATNEEIIQASKGYRLATIRTEAKTLIESKWPSWRQNNCALGVYPDTVTQECADDIAAVIAASNTAEDAIDAATTVAEVEAVTATWPVI